MLLNVLLRLTGSLQAPGGAAFPGLLSFPPGMPSFSTTASPAALSGLHNSAMQSALLQVFGCCYYYACYYDYEQDILEEFATLCKC